MKRLTSRQNPLVTTFRAIARGRDPEGRVVLDGPHLVQEALAAAIEIPVAMVEPGLAASEEGARILDGLARAGTSIVEVSPPVLAAASPVSSPSGIVAIARRPATTLLDVLGGADRLVVAGVDVQEPGNVGAIVRAAEAGGATGAIFCGASADPFGGKALRGSMGSALRLPIARLPSASQVIAAARGARLRVVAAVARDGEPLHQVDLTPPTLLLLGGEGPGLAPDMVAAADAAVAIPMTPPVESLNVAVAAALLVYEAYRQRSRAPRRATENGA